MASSIQCPACKRKLNVPETLLGKRVKCPSCGEGFQASPTPPEPAGPKKAKPPLTESIAPALKPPAKPSASKGIEDEPDAETEYEYEDESEKKPVARRRPRDDDEKPRPARRRRNDDDDDDDEDDYSIRRRGRPHRGGLILTLGILSLFVWCCPIAGWIVGGIVLNMANKDLAEMATRRMDDSGRGITMAGKICAIVGLVLATVNVVGGAILRVTNRI
jgi:hypothetical protein